MEDNREEIRCAAEGGGGSGITRRRFITTMGAGAVGVAASGSLSGAAVTPESGVVTAGSRVPLTLSVNGRPHRVLVEARWTLLYVLREVLGFTGAKEGCERGECGSCTVLIDDVPRYACMILALEAEGTEITTVEGLMDGEALGPVQQAFADEDAFQCGYCTPGQVVAVEGLLRKHPSPTIPEIRRGISGNLCRCGAYAHIVKAADRAAKGRKGGDA